MIDRISGMIQTCQMNITAYAGNTRIQTIPIEVDGIYHPAIVGDEINPPESEKFEIVAVRIMINEEWISWKLADYAALEEQILESIV